ncbi:MAG TPA: hypothetical protein VK524_20480 [Polyangiaceae bacterium]|nr:hypothetical protein [Polyangiaceae bacterium]
MKHQIDNPDEALLRELFDASAEEPDGPLLTKLSARAAEIPSLPRRAPRWFPRWAWAPSTAGLAAAAGALAVTLSSWFGQPAEDVLPAAAAPVVALAPIPQAILPQNPQKKPSTTRGMELPALGDLEASELDVDPEALELGAEAALASELDALHGPVTDAELDAWLHATSELLHDG